MSKTETIPLISLDGIAVRQRDRWLLNGLSWRISAGEQWAVVGANGAGKTTLAKAVAGILPVVQGKIHYHQTGGLTSPRQIAYLASDARRDLWRRERQLDFSRHFAGEVNTATSAGEMIASHAPADLTVRQRQERLSRLANQLNLGPLLNKPILTVSTGEMSRVLIAGQLIQGPRMLILDEPFEGLDSDGRRMIMELLGRLTDDGLSVLLVTHRLEEMLPAITHVLTLENGRKVSAGPIERCPLLFSPKDTAKPSRRGLDDSPRPNGCLSVPLVDMQSVSVRYDDVTVLDGFTWAMHEGDNWAITGGNGAGKSTILRLISGDCLQVHANCIRLFGKDRGPDQSLFEVRQKLGLVSHDLATAYQKNMTALDVVCSGFFDSVGLYRTCSRHEIEVARGWLEKMNIGGLAQTPFNQLSQGQRQMILIARAMVKTPRLLMLDEPCSGLDVDNRARVLRQVEKIGSNGTNLIFVSHHKSEIPRCITHRLVLKKRRVAFQGAVIGDQ